MFLSKDWDWSDNFGNPSASIPTIFNSKGFQLSPSFLQLLLTYPFPFIGLLVANIWNLIFFPINITLLQHEQFSFLLLSCEVRHMVYFSVIANPMFFLTSSKSQLIWGVLPNLHRRKYNFPMCDAVSRISCRWWDCQVYPYHRKYRARAEERGWATGRLLKSWTRVSVTTELYCDFLETISALTSLQLLPYGRWEAEFIPVVPDLDFSKGESSGVKHKPLWLYWMLI